MSTFLVDSNDTWFVGIYSNNFKDRQDEIITYEAHKDFAQWTRKYGIKPPIILHHLPQYPPEVHLANLLGLSKGIFTPEEYNDNMLTMYKATAIAQAEYIIPMSGFMVVLGKVFPEKVPAVRKHLSKKSVNYGMSHGFLGLKEDNLITKYFSHEFTILSKGSAANFLTAVGIREKDMDMLDTLTTEENEFLQSILGQQASEVLKESADTLKNILSKVVDTKSVEEPEKEEEVAEETTVTTTEEVAEVEVTAEPYEEVREKIMKDLNVGGLMETVNGLSASLAELSARAEQIETRLKQVEVDEDTKIAAQFIVPNWAAGSVKSEPAEDEAEVIAQLKAELPGILNDSNNDDNVLKIALWDALGAK